MNQYHKTLIIDLHNESFFHGTFNASIIFGLKASKDIFLLENHKIVVDQLLENAGASLNVIGVKKIIKSKFLNQLFLLCFYLLSNRNKYDKYFVLATSSSGLAILALLYPFMPKTLIFMHALDSILRKSLRARILTSIAFAFSKCFQPKNKITLIYQKKPKEISSILSNNIFARDLINELAMPHPIWINKNKIGLKFSDVKSERVRRLCFLGEVRLEKNPAVYKDLVDKYQSPNVIACQISNYFNLWHTPLVSHIIPKGDLASELKSSDIVFCAYDQSHYIFTESGTLIDAIGKSCWLIVHSAEIPHLKKCLNSKLKYINIDGGLALVKPGADAVNIWNEKSQLIFKNIESL